MSPERLLTKNKGFDALRTSYDLASCGLRVEMAVVDFLAQPYNKNNIPKPNGTVLEALANKGSNLLVDPRVQRILPNAQDRGYHGEKYPNKNTNLNAEIIKRSEEVYFGLDWYMLRQTLAYNYTNSDSCIDPNSPITKDELPIYLQAAESNGFITLPDGLNKFSCYEQMDFSGTVLSFSVSLMRDLKVGINQNFLDLEKELILSEEMRPKLFEAAYLKLMAMIAAIDQIAHHSYKKGSPISSGGFPPEALTDNKFLGYWKNIFGEESLPNFGELIDQAKGVVVRYANRFNEDPEMSGFVNHVLSLDPTSYYNNQFT